MLVVFLPAVSESNSRLRSCFWSFRCWRSSSIFAVMAQTSSSQSFEGTPPSSSKLQVRHCAFSSVQLSSLCRPLSHLDSHSLFSLSVYSGPPDPIHGTALYQKVRNTAQVRRRLYLSIMSMSIMHLWQLGKRTQLTIFTCRKWLGYFSQIQFPPQAAFPHPTWSPQLWVSYSKDHTQHIWINYNVI